MQGKPYLSLIRIYIRPKISDVGYPMWGVSTDIDSLKGLELLYGAVVTKLVRQE